MAQPAGPTCCAWIIGAYQPRPSTSAPALAAGSAGSAPTMGWVPGGQGWWEVLPRGDSPHSTAHLYWPNPTSRSAATKASASVSQTGQAKTAAFTTPCPHPPRQGRQRDTRVRLEPAGVGLCLSLSACLFLPTELYLPPQVPAAPTSSSAPSQGLSWSQPSSWEARAGDLSKRHTCTHMHVHPPSFGVLGGIRTPDYWS